MSNKFIEFELDGRKVKANEDETIWQVSERLGQTIPHLCYSPAESYRPDGNCRACMVEIDGERTLAASCIRKPHDGMKVFSNSSKATKSRSLVLELLHSDHPDNELSHNPKSLLNKSNYITAVFTLQLNLQF